MGKRKQMDDGVPSREDKRAKRQTSAATTSTPSRVLRSVKAQTTAAARDAVFKTTELLENILIQLPPMNIIQVQRVSKLFKEVIENSPTAHKLLSPEVKSESKHWAVKFDFTRQRWFYGQSGTSKSSD
ncbi:hypothetical protein CLAFUW4_12322 [Fulvia fulva]|uniref:F-box domain-containing protein n=1 Tax=Passalora fulva TaxID=5499 RepID=A0A9Q8PDS0_PASFU|nr:uncharacterized protein CLAFUR5_11352 [Fulvia fulva]KAK4618055.1 hypothetical protein CLAFUR4_12327 [Fulvia fulva]KAK4618893.1 hypothetical protein CLAFUR0_12338 [Fulvia fulva]UJO20570.1 hypothetical protein CLAFUR5_11352 [Fulvia fulva]WPV18270.1 hypothetical protein CLAFUW4_12322 [Fulvia fulva]WPV33645.1 hypothetical protein CLAFUW7_12329 [Fulvia fulva]